MSRMCDNSENAMKSDILSKENDDASHQTWYIIFLELVSILLEECKTESGKH